MIDRAVQVMDWRYRMIGDLGAWTVGLEVVQQRPASYLEFGRAEMSMKETSIEQTAGQGFHVPVDHITGAMGLGIVESQGKTGRFSSQFVNGFQSRTGQMLSRPGVEVTHLLVESLNIDRMISIPDALLNGNEQRLEALGTVTDV